MKSTIAVLGTGRMGSALARALVGAGHPTTVWNRTRAKADPLAAIGVTVAATVRKAVDAADIVIVNVSDYAASATLLRDPAVAPALAGKLVIELTSGTPDGARDASRWAAGHYADYLDGAIMATPDYIGTEAGTILVSGPSEAFERGRATLDALGGNIQHVGEELGRANALDAAILSQMWGALFGTLNGIAVCQAEGVGLDMLADHASATAPVIQGLVDDLIRRTREGRHAADDASFSTIETNYIPFRHLVDLMEARAIDRSIVDGYDRIFQRAIAAGHLHDDFAAMTGFMKEA